jgi:hypothetical protein
VKKESESQGEGVPDMFRVVSLTCSRFGCRCGVRLAMPAAARARWITAIDSKGFSCGLNPMWDC